MPLQTSEHLFHASEDLIDDSIGSIINTLVMPPKSSVRASLTGEGALGLCVVIECSVSCV